MLRRQLILFFSIIFFGACTSIKTGWDNFNARYNAFYNADRSYEQGFDKVKNVKTEYSALIPIRIYEAPISTGVPEFEKAINKSADVLRKHPQSKWVDPSLFIIGKSYYFRKEYYSAEQKFQELYQSSQNDDYVQRSVIWKGKVYLDMRFYEQGVQYLNEQIILLDDIWSNRYLNEAKSVLAELYVKLEKWDLAAALLEEAVPGLKDKVYRERGFFLLGQIYDRLNNIDSAMKAYNKVGENYHDYNIQYLAKRKIAESARALGDYGTALATFKSMVKDDKNVEFKSELEYEVGRTLQAMADYKQAERTYKQLLGDTQRRPNAEILAKTYYGLAEIQRFGYNNFTMAAAYYDTAAKQNANPDKLPQNWQAKALADSFGSYAALKNDIQYRDSLLWVANLPKDEFETLIVTLRQKRLDELLAQQKQREKEGNVLVNVTPQQPSAPQTSNNGFLNIRNPELLAEGKVQFRAIWGNRVLADNWRVGALLKNTVSEAVEEADEQVENAAGNALGFSDAELKIDISNVPFSPVQQESMKEEIANLTYELGNLFFLSLDLPDSADFYFAQVINDFPASTMVPIAYYSISELNAVKGDSSKAREYATTLVSKYPASRYAGRLAEKFGLEIAEDTSVKERDFTASVNEILADTVLTRLDKLTMVSELVRLNQDDPSAPAILYGNIQEYILLAKLEPVYVENISARVLAQQKWKAENDSLALKKKEAAELLKDTTLTGIERKGLEQLRDSTMHALDLTQNFPYVGEYWDSVRTNITSFLEMFGKSPLKNELNLLKAELQVPVVKAEAVEEEKIPEPAHNDTFLSCNDVGAEAVIRGGKANFMQSVVLDEEDLPIELTYRFVINQRGIIQAYEPLGDYSENVRASMNSAFEESLTFEPVLFEGEAVTVQCDVTFSFD